MGAFGRTLGAMFRRPFIIFFIGIFTLLYAFMDYFFPILNMIFLMNSFITGDFFQSAVSLIQWILKLVFTLKGLLVISGLVIIGSFIFALIFSGFFGTVQNSLEKKAGFQGECKESFNKHFAMVWLISMVCILFGVCFLLVLMVAFIPALIITKAAIAGKSGFFIIAVPVDIITLGVAFFGIMFIRVYLIFWFPAIYASDDKVFSKGKAMVDHHFWPLVARFFIMDLLYLSFSLFVAKAGNTLGLLPVKWVFYTLFWSFFTTYIFSLFKSYSYQEERAVQSQGHEI